MMIVKMMKMMMTQHQEAINVARHNNHTRVVVQMIAVSNRHGLRDTLRRSEINPKCDHQLQVRQKVFAVVELFLSRFYNFLIIMMKSVLGNSITKYYRFIIR